MRCSRKTAIFLAFSLAFTIEPVVASPTDTPTYHVVNLEVRALLKELARTQNIRISPSHKTRGTVQGLSLGGDIGSMLNDLGTALNLDWFHYNGVYYVSTREEATTRIVALNDISPQSAIEALKDAGLWQIEYPMARTFEDGVLILSGPPQLLALIESVVQFKHATTAKGSVSATLVRVRRAGKSQLVEIGTPDDELTMDGIDPAKAK